jgi:hypothetical protein
VVVGEIGTLHQTVAATVARVGKLRGDPDRVVGRGDLHRDGVEAYERLEPVRLRTRLTAPHQHQQPDDGDG